MMDLDITQDFRSQNWSQYKMFECQNILCGWTGKNVTTDIECPVCGSPVEELVGVTE